MPAVAVSTTDGCVRIWRGYDRPHTLHLLTAWQVSASPTAGSAAGSSIPGGGEARGATAAVAWQPARAMLAAAGGGGADVCLWDVRAEQLTSRYFRLVARGCKHPK
jgi:hypothetical protein